MSFLFTASFLVRCYLGFYREKELGEVVSDPVHSGISKLVPTEQSLEECVIVIMLR